MYRKILFFTFLALVYSCGKNGGDGGNSGYPIPLHYLDSSGNDLFSIYNDGHNGFWMDSIVISNIKTGNQYYSLNCFSDLTQPYKFQDLVVMTMLVCPNINITNQYAYTIIQLKKGMIDTLKIHINQQSVSQSSNDDSIWYNGILTHYDSTATIPIIK